jgi:DNA polymerase-3 subunit delta'
MVSASRDAWKMTTAAGFDAIVGQQHPVRLLKTFVRNSTQPHALLFTGDDGVGKKMTARAFAMACNCLKLKSIQGQHVPLEKIDACGDCAPCRKIAGNHHPDVIHVAPLSSVIRIAQIRALLQTLTLKPNEADRRVVMISDAQAMNPEAANALLKVLEEPPDRTLLVLTAGQPTDLLPTVVSRCRQIRFSPLPEAAIERLLTMEGGIEPDQAKTVAPLCGGSYTRAQQRIDRRWLNRREWILRSLGSLMTSTAKPEVRTWLALSERLTKERDLVEESLEIITMWLRDLLVVRLDPQRVLNRDRLDALASAAVKVNRQSLLEQIDAIEEALAALRSNTNTRLTLDAMVLRMAGACSSPM